MFTFSKPGWETIKDKKVYETPIFSLHQKKMMPAGSKTPANFYVLNAPEWINVIALTKKQEIVLVEQYRHGVDTITLEIPGGMTDPGETPMEAARRELSEETGYSSSTWSSLGKVSSNPAILTNYTHLYVAEECEQTLNQHTDGHEDINVHILPVGRFLKLVETGDIHHSIVVAAVAKLFLKRPELALFK